MPRAKTPRNGSSTKQSRVSAPKNGSATRNLENEIRIRAYEIYEQRAGTPGSETDDWLVAEREIVARYTPQEV